jgi:hypothetical protein
MVALIFPSWLLSLKLTLHCILSQWVLQTLAIILLGFFCPLFCCCCSYSCATYPSPSKPYNFPSLWTGHCSATRRLAVIAPDWELVKMSSIRRSYVRWLPDSAAISSPASIIWKTVHPPAMASKTLWTPAPPLVSHHRVVRFWKISLKKQQHEWSGHNFRVTKNLLNFQQEEVNTEQLTTRKSDSVKNAEK